jgi:quinol-cytochrome oxidoreductase complex cytochrome b subunit
MASTVPRRRKVKTRRANLVEQTVLVPLDWIDERTAAVRGTKWFLFRHVPRDVSWMQTLGSATLTAFIVQALTGAILAMYYQPSASIDPTTGKPVAYSSIQSITNDLTLGWLVRGMHHWGASVFIILLFLHMGRVCLFGAYKYPRELTWVTGVLLLATGMLMGFTGYLLPWDQTAYWATAVGVNLNGTAPFLGPWLAQFLAGGPEIANHTLTIFYAMHMLLLPGAIFALIGLHIYLVTRLGVTSPPWSKEAAGRDRPPKVPTGGRPGLVRPGGDGAGDGARPGLVRTGGSGGSS